MKRCWNWGAWVASASLKVLIWKIWARVLKIRVKMAPNVVWLQKVAPKVCRKNMKTFFRSYTKKRFSWSLWRICVGKSCTKNFSGKFLGKSGKILRTPKICLLLHLWWKGTSAPVATLLKGQRGNALAIPPFSGVPVHIILRALFTRYYRLQCVAAMNINYSGLLRQSSSWLKKYPAMR